MYILKFTAISCVAALLGASSLNAQNSESDAQTKAREALRQKLADLDAATPATNTFPATPTAPAFTPTPAPAPVVVTPPIAPAAPAVSAQVPTINLPPDTALPPAAHLTTPAPVAAPSAAIPDAAILSAPTAPAPSSLSKDEEMKLREAMRQAIANAPAAQPAPPALITQTAPPAAPVTPPSPAAPIAPTNPVSPVTPPGPASPVTPPSPSSPVTPTHPPSPITPPGPANSFTPNAYSSVNTPAVPPGSANMIVASDIPASAYIAAGAPTPAKISADSEDKVTQAMRQAKAQLDVQDPQHTMGTTVIIPAATAAPQRMTQNYTHDVPPPAALIPGSKEQKLYDLLQQYKQDRISPVEYHQQRVKILAEP